MESTPDVDRRLRQVQDITFAVGRAALTLAPGGSAVLVLLDFAKESATNRAVEAAEAIASRVGMEQLRQRLAADDETAMLFTLAVDGAMRTSLESKRRLLARVAATALSDDTMVDDSALIIDALRDLDGPHIRALARLADSDPSLQTEPGARSDFTSVVEKEHHAVLAGLTRHGLLLQTVTYDGKPVVTRVSDFGRRLLEMLSDEE